MNHETQRASILQMAQGAFQERVDYEMQRCVDNILDVNTKATAKRKITLTIELTPDDDRRQIRVNVVQSQSVTALLRAAWPDGNKIRVGKGRNR